MHGLEQDDVLCFNAAQSEAGEIQHSEMLSKLLMQVRSYESVVCSGHAHGRCVCGIL